MKSRLAIFTFILGGLIVACGGSGGSNAAPTVAPGTKLTVVATTVQIAALTREVGGDHIQLRGIVPAGADPHEFEPVPSDLTAIEGANLILRHGMGLDAWLDGTLKAAKRASVVVVTNGIKTLKAEEEGKKVDDPHVWHSPNNDKVMVDDIAAALSKADPASKADYHARASDYKQKLDATKTQVQSIINEVPPDSRKLVTDHDAFQYFAAAFGLEIVGVVFPALDTESQPSAKSTADLLNTIKKEKVKAVFSEGSVNSTLARSLAADAGVKIVDDLYGDSLGKPGSGAETVDGMLLTNARKIADALK